MHVCMMHTSVILDHEICVYDAHVSMVLDLDLTLMHVCLMHKSMVYDESVMHDA